MSSPRGPVLSEMAQRYARRNTWWYRRLRPPLPLVHNPAERLLPPSNGGRCLLIGGAAQVVPRGFINVDLLRAPGVHVVADAARLPFREAQFERIECDAVLEHVRDPVAVRDEIFRTLAPGGYVHVGVPFNHPYHGYPLDFQRWTRLGLETFMSRFEIVDTGIRTGPAATWLLTTLEFLKIVVRGTPGKVLGAAAGWVLWPVRYVDLLLYRREEAHVLANTICVLARKPVAGQSQPADR